MRNERSPQANPPRRVLDDLRQSPSVECMLEDQDLAEDLGRGAWTGIGIRAFGSGVILLSLTAEQVGCGPAPRPSAPGEASTPESDTWSSTPPRPLRSGDRLMVFRNPRAARGAEGYAEVVEVLRIDPTTGLTLATVDFYDEVFRPVERLVSPWHRVLGPGERPSRPR